MLIEQLKQCMFIFNNIPFNKRDLEIIKIRIALTNKIDKLNEETLCQD